MVSEAAQIDALAPQAKPHTDAQRAAVAAAPASQVKTILKEKDAMIADGTKESAKLRQDLAKAEDKFSATLRWILTGGGALIMALGVGSLFLMGQLAAVFPGIGPRISISIAAIASQEREIARLNTLAPTLVVDEKAAALAELVVAREAVEIAQAKLDATEKTTSIKNTNP